MIVMQAPAQNLEFTNLPSGASYTSNQFGLVLITNGSTADQLTLANSGCVTLAAQKLNLLAFQLNVNMNQTLDTLVSTIVNTQKFRLTKITVCNPTISLTTVAGGIYTGASKTGTTIVAAGQSYSSLTAGGIALDLTLAAPNGILPVNTPLYISMTTPQGAAALADFYFFGDQYQQ